MWNNNPYEFGAPDLDWLRTQVCRHHRNVIVSHQPPYTGTMTATQDAEWKGIRDESSVMAAIHGHTHVVDMIIEDERLPIFTVPWVLDGRHGFVEFDEMEIRFYDCRDGGRVEVSE